MRIGELRHRISIQRPTRTRNPSGGSLTTYTELASVWANVSPVSAYERAQAQQLQQDLSHKIVIRYRPDIDPTMRILFKGMAFEIQGIKNLDERNEWFELRAVQRGAAA